MSSLAVGADGALVLNGVPMPFVIVESAGFGGGGMILDSQRHEVGVGADHVFQGWEDWEPRLDLRIIEPRDGGTERYDDLATLRAAARARDGEVPAVYALGGRLATALGVDRVLIVGLADGEDDTAGDDLTLSMRLVEVDPADQVIMQQAQERTDAADDEDSEDQARAEPSSDDVAQLDSLLAQLGDPNA